MHVLGKPSPPPTFGEARQTFAPNGFLSDTLGECLRSSITVSGSTSGSSSRFRWNSAMSRRAGSTCPICRSTSIVPRRLLDLAEVEPLPSLAVTRACLEIDASRDLPGLTDLILQNVDRHVLENIPEEPAEVRAAHALVTEVLYR